MSNVFQNKEAEKVGSCLSLEELTKYVNGELTEKEKFSFEKHLVECELCTDAIEGFSHLSDQETLNHVIDSLQSDISARSGFKPRKGIVLGWRKVTAIAATLIFLAGAGFLISGMIKHNGSLAWFSLENDSETVASATKSDNDVLSGANKSIEKESRDPSAVEDGIFDQSVPSTSPVEDEQIAQATDRITQQNGVDEPSDDDQSSQQSMLREKSQSEAENSLYKLKPEANLLAPVSSTGKPIEIVEDAESSAEPEEDAVGEELIVRGATAPDANGNNQVVDQGYKAYMADKETTSSKSISQVSSLESTSSKKKDKATPSMESAMAKYNSTDFKKAINDFEVLLSASPNNRKVLYHLAVSNMNLGKNNKAIPYFDQLIVAPGTYTESSKWLKAQILIKKNKKPEARKLLQDLANGNGRYSDKAFDLIQKL